MQPALPRHDGGRKRKSGWTIIWGVRSSSSSKTAEVQLIIIIIHTGMNKDCGSCSDVYKPLTNWENDTLIWSLIYANLWRWSIESNITLFENFKIHILTPGLHQSVLNKCMKEILIGFMIFTFVLQGGHPAISNKKRYSKLKDKYPLFHVFEEDASRKRINQFVHNDSELKTRRALMNTAGACRAVHWRKGLMGRMKRRSERAW